MPARRAVFHSPNPSAHPVGRQWKKERVTQVHTPPSVRRIVRQRVAAVTVSVFAAGLLIGVTSSAGAAPAPTVSQVEAKLAKLKTQQEKLDQQYDQVQQQLQATNQRLALVNKELGAFSAKFNTMRQQIARIAVTAYEDGNLNNSVTLLTSGKPQQILDQSSILLELSATDNAQIDAFLAAAKQLTSTQQIAHRTKVGIEQLKAGLAKRKSAMNKLVSQESGLLAQLQPAQAAAAIGGGGSHVGIKYTGPETTQAEKAVAFAYSKVGCPYEWGGTGPCADGYDCSGLTMTAWASGGVSIPRTSESQESELPQVDIPAGNATKYLEPGDILGFIGNAHVGIYIGNDKLIDAPQTGEDVEVVSLTGWYLDNLDGAVRP
jgi:cell wall-associated NlpC family hydrolase